MTKKIRKSVMATGLAAATLVTSAFNSHVKAEEAAKNTDEIKKNDDKVTDEKSTDKKEMTLEDLQELKSQVEQDKKSVEEQSKETETAKAEAEQASEAVKAAEAELEAAQNLENEATEDTIAQAETEATSAQEAIAEKEAKVTEAKEAEAKASQAVRDQETKVAEQEKAVQTAEAELKKASGSLVKEEQAIKVAKDVQKSAESDVTKKEAEVKSAETAAQKLVQEKTQTEAQLKTAESNLAKTDAAIASKEKEVSQASRNTQNKQVVRNAGYAGFLSSVNSASFQQAVAKYNGNGVNVNADVASLQNALRAVEIMKKVNQYRRNAGLNELYVDVNRNVESQLQTLGFDAKGWHTSQFFGYENVAWGFSGTGGVDYWYNERPLWLQSGGTSNERAINAGQAYREHQGNFASFGHYVTMMGNEFDTISAAVATINGKAYSEAGFHKATNLQAGLQNGTIMTVAKYEQALRNYINNANTDVNLSGLSTELTALKRRREQEANTVSSLKSKVTGLNSSIANQNKVIATAKSNVTAAKRVVTASKATVASKQDEYNRALAKIASQIKPQTDKVSTEKTRLAVEQGHLTKLNTAKTSASNLVAQANLQVTQAKAAYKVKVDRLNALKNASQSVATAKANLENLKATAGEKSEAYKTEQVKLEAMEKALAELTSKYEEQVAQFKEAHPEVAPYITDSGDLTTKGDQGTSNETSQPAVRETSLQLEANVSEGQALEVQSYAVTEAYADQAEPVVEANTGLAQANPVPVSAEVAEASQASEEAEHSADRRKTKVSSPAKAVSAPSKEVPAEPKKASSVEAEETTESTDDSTVGFAAAGVAAVAAMGLAGVAVKKKD